MPFCEFCGDEIGYLPFKCKYCAGTYCQNHRLPENHDCSFKVKHTPVSPHIQESRPLYQDSSARSTERNYDYRPRRQKRIKQSSMGFSNSGFGSAGQTKGTSWIIVLILILSIVALFIPEFLCLSIPGIINVPPFFWTFVTSLFVSYTPDMFGLLFLFIMLFFLYNIARNIEVQFVTNFLIKLYFFCAGFSALFYVLIMLALGSAGYPIFNVIVPVGFATGAILGLIAFIIYFRPNQEMMLLCFFIPVKMKGRLLLIILILFRLIPGLLFAFFMDMAYLAMYLPDLGGILASYLVYYRKFKYRKV